MSRHNETLSDIYFRIKAGLRIGKKLHEFIDILDDITIEHPELSQHIVLDPKKYHRSVVISDKKLEMVVISWLPNQSSDVHGHPGECIYKVLRGTLQEDLYSKRSIKKNVFSEGKTEYICNNIGYHAVKNIEDSYAITLHVYSPSFDC